MARPVDPNAKVELLRAAEAVFVERGLERARVEEITARAGRSKGSFYLHFESKEEAFRHIVEAMVARLASFIDDMDPSCCPVDATQPEVAEAWFEREVELFEFLWQNRGLTRLLLHGGGSAQFGHLVDAIAERARERTKGWLALGMSRGYYRPDLDVEVASVVVAGAYDRIARTLVRQDRKPDIRAWVRGVQRVLLGGLLDPRLAGAALAQNSQVPDPPVSHVAPRPGTTASPASSSSVPSSPSSHEPGGVRLAKKRAPRRSTG
ncbi:MAG: TetR/AcrR family transcriptional regulator [Deltaproteobacteria bacterium]|nr:TetR/AcrR family transcriptional regulator [Deltaproteobacteria bacterium]